MTNNKYLYIAQWNFSLGNGISNKIASQVEALNQINPTDLCLIEQDKLTFNGQSITSKNNSLFGRLCKYKRLYSVIKKNNYSLIYVRHIVGFNSILFFIITLLVKGKTKINIEIPTYPFTGEGESTKILTKITNFIQNSYKYTVNSITYMGSPQKEIWGIPAINFVNGISVEKYKLLTKNRLDDCLNIIGVGSLDFWHGYDRAIEGIAKSKNNIVLHIVGDGKELNSLRELAIKLNVEKNVIFHGKLHSHKLDDVFAVCHLAIDSLGRHRSGNNYNSSIKSKEYSARGLPFIQSHIDQSFVRCDFVLKVSPDEQVIDFDKVFYWYKELKPLPVDIRNFAINNLQWKFQFEKLLPIYSTDNV
jgi:hypothetical protein